MRGPHGARWLVLLGVWSSLVACSPAPVAVASDRAATPPSAAPRSTSALSAPPAATAAAPAPRPTQVPAELASCLPTITWRQGPLGVWGTSAPFPGPEALARWRRARPCVQGTPFSAVLIETELHLDALFMHPCQSPRQDPTGWRRAQAALPIADDLRTYLLDLAGVYQEVGEHAAEESRERPDPLATDWSHSFGGPPGQYHSFRLAIAPMPTDELLGCMTSPDADHDAEVSGAFLARWRDRWGATPYEMHGGGFVLRVPSPPTQLADIAEVAVELARYNREMGIFGDELYFSQAASRYWYFWWD